MKIKKEYVLRNVAGENIVLPTGIAARNTNAMITLNETAVFIWKKLQEGREKEEIVKDMLDEYDIDEEIAIRDVEGFSKMLLERGFAEE